MNRSYFKGLEIDSFIPAASSNAFSLSPQKIIVMDHASI